MADSTDQECTRAADFMVVEDFTVAAADTGKHCGITASEARFDAPLETWGNMGKHGDGTYSRLFPIWERPFFPNVSIPPHKQSCARGRQSAEVAALHSGQYVSRKSCTHTEYGADSLLPFN
jgi:hypothetical protein